MKLRSLGPVFICLFAIATFAQTKNPPSQDDAYKLLQRVSQHYADAKSYRIEEVKEITTTSDLAHEWRKTLYIVAETSEGRHHFESHSDMGSAEKISDGTTEWVYHFEEKAYTKKSASEKIPSHPLPYSEIALTEAANLRRSLGDTANHYQSAELLPDADLTADGKQISCYRIHLQTKDRKRVDPNYPFDIVLWIDKTRETILKMEERARVFLHSGNARIPREQDTITLYPRVELDAEIPNDLFTFTPPEDAQLLEDFPDPIQSGMGANLLGRTAPPLKLKASDGSLVYLDSFRGKPVLIDLWATWCGPCVESFPKLSALYDETKDKGLVFLSIDRDEEAKLATDFLARKGYHWQNFHDSGDVSGILGESGIPRTLLIDPQGKVVFDRVAPTDGDLRNQIASFGPEYASVKPKPAEVPCTTAKQ